MDSITDPMKPKEPNYWRDRIPDNSKLRPKALFGKYVSTMLGCHIDLHGPCGRMTHTHKSKGALVFSMLIP